MVKHILKTRKINGSTYALLPAYILKMEGLIDDKLVMADLEKVPRASRE